MTIEIFDTVLFRFYGMLGILHMAVLVTFSTLAATETQVTFVAAEMLGRPTDSSITVNAVTDQDLEVYCEYGTQPGCYSDKTEMTLFTKGEPIELVMKNLIPDTRYYYRLCYRPPGESEFQAREEYTFHTQRAPGSTFTFVIQADSHLGTEKHCNPELYKITLLNALSDQPDFLFDLGDTFRATKIKEVNYAEVAKLYLEQRRYLGLLCHSAPFFFVIGNHEAEAGWELDGTPENIAVWAAKARKLYVPNPFPDGFYSGNSNEEEYIGPGENYYAWEWGGALFVVLDHYRYTTVDPKDDGTTWDWSLGENQYRWLEQILEGSKSTFKFVFCHHILGACRGAVEWAPYYEWGGRNKSGDWEFDEHRPDWGEPVHQLMADNNVTIFFQGHDHIFVKQELDGIVYQTCPMPADPTYTFYNEESYKTGNKYPNAGHVRVTVSDSAVIVDYIRAYLPKDEDDQHKNGEVAFSYTIKAADSAATSVAYPPEIPEMYFLEQNYPNPFNTDTNITFRIPQTRGITLAVYNALGQKVRTLCERQYHAGMHTISWNGQDDRGERLSSGLYFYEFRAGAFGDIKKVVLMQ